MIVIEIRIGREAPRQTPGELLDPVLLATALRPRISRPERWVWRLGRRGVAAAVASVLGVASLALVPGEDAPVAATVQPVAHTAPLEVPAAGADVDGRTHREIERMARDLTAAALERVRAREVAAGMAPIAETAKVSLPSGAGLGFDAEVPQAFAVTSQSAGRPNAPAGAASRQPHSFDLPAEDEVTHRQRPRGGAVVQQSLAAVTVVADAVANPESGPLTAESDESGARSGPDALAHAADSGRVAPTEPVVPGTEEGARITASAVDPGRTDLADAAASMADVANESGTGPAATPAVTPAAAARFTITRERGAEIQGVLATLHERASRGDWTGVSELLAHLRTRLPEEGAAGVAGGDPTLATTLTKWDARVALQAGDAAAAVTALEGLTGQLDDEALALKAVAWLRTGAANRAVGVYRDLLLRRPDDARLWLGLGLALESSAADPAAIRFAYTQTVALAQEPSLRAAAEARLAPPQA